MAEANQDEPTELEQAHEEEKTVSTTVSDIELEHLRNEVKEFKDKYLLLLAESENSRKRLQKERQELIEYAIKNIVLDMLHPLDHMENALSFSDSMSEEVRHWAQGFQMILTQFKDALANHSVKAFNSKGEHFDPHFHEAIEMVTTDVVAPGVVVEESVRGYKLGDKIIRPARVKVAQSKPKEEELQESKEKE